MSEPQSIKSTLRRMDAEAGRGAGWRLREWREGQDPPLSRMDLRDRLADLFRLSKTELTPPAERTILRWEQGRNVPQQEEMREALEIVTGRAVKAEDWL